MARLRSVKPLGRRQVRSLAVVLLAMGCCFLPVQTIRAVEPLKVAFINPGHPASFWSHVEDVMRDAATDLGIELTVFNAGGERSLMINMARRAFQLADRPDAVILVNEQQTGGAMIEAADRANIPAFMILSLFTGRDADYYGEPRRSFSNWIGSLRPDHEKAGYTIAHALIEQGRAKFGDKLRILALSGNVTSQAASRRAAGLRRAIGENSGVELVSLLNADWRRDYARRHVRRMLRVHPDIRLIWAANDDMVMGALDAAEETGLVPGKDLLLGGLNWSDEALSQLRAGRLAVDVGGHFMGGGLALVLIHDYLNGRDFADQGVAQVFDMGSFDPSNLPDPEHMDFSRIDFRSLSRILNPRQKGYRFEIDHILGQIATGTAAAKSGNSND